MSEVSYDLRRRFAFISDVQLMHDSHSTIRMKHLQFKPV